MEGMDNFFYCYTRPLFEYLRFRKGFWYVCTGLSRTTHLQFWQFKRTPELDAALIDFQAITAA